MTDRLSVRRLAELIHRRGDLYHRVGVRTRAEEGISTQRLLQASPAAGYEIERPVSGQFALGAQTVQLAGRIDGCHAGQRLLEEFKTTRGDPHLAHEQHASAHWAQLQLYAALLSDELGVDPRSCWTLRLVYAHPDSLALTTFERAARGSELKTFLNRTLAAYEQWLADSRAHRAHRDQCLDVGRFPFANYRPHQRAMARRVYRALRDGERLLLEAPTGSGKTMAVLYPALRALVGSRRRVFYVTSRGTGANAVLSAVRQLDGTGRFLRVVHLRAKEASCQAANPDCARLDCPLAVGYFDRAGAAVRTLLSERYMDQAAVLRVARDHQVCPFELALDAARWADLVIGDCNYLFDPVVRLQRFADEAELVVLIDEAHQLSARVQDMLSLTLHRGALRAALAEPGPALVRQRLAALDRRLAELRAPRSPTTGNERIIAAPDRLLRAIDRLLAAAVECEFDLAHLPHTRAVYFECVRWARSRAWFDAASCTYLVATVAGPHGLRDVTLRLVHLDPGAHVARVLGGLGPHVRFSGSVTPLELYQRLHGFAGEPAERVASPFCAAQLGVWIVNDIGTEYRQRRGTLPALARLVSAVAAQQPGNYLVALPSFEYLDDLAAELCRAHPGVASLTQARRMDAAAREEFLTALQRGTRTVALVVMGGIFAESVDFADATGSTLRGVICVGVGLPPPTPERDAAARYFEGCGEIGQAIAYHQPAMTKVLQAAGRLLRGPADRGVLCLVDRRFGRPEYRRFFPAHWQPRAVTAAHLGAEVQKFWRRRTGSPRLPRAIAETPNDP